LGAAKERAATAARDSILADSALNAALTKRDAAEGALAEATAKAKKKKPPDEFVEALTACEAAVAECQAAVDDSRLRLSGANDMLRQARVEAEAKKKAAELAALEGKLRSVHLSVTGRYLPCRIPPVLQAHRALVRERPQELCFSLDTMRSCLLNLSIAFDVRALRALFADVERDERPGVGLTQPGMVSLAMLRRHCSQEPPAPAMAWDDTVSVTSSVARLAPAMAPAATTQRARPSSAAVTRSGNLGGGANSHRPPPARPGSAKLPRGR